MAGDTTTAEDALVRRPRPELTGYVDRLVGYDLTLPEPGQHRGLPSSSVTFVISFSEPLRAGWFHPEVPDGAVDSGDYWTCVSGLHARPAQILHDGRQYGLMLGMTPAGTRAILGVPAAAVRGTMCTVDDLVGGIGGSLAERLEELPTWRDRFNALEQILLTLVRRHDKDRARADLSWAWQQLVGSGGRRAVGELAGELGWSRQYLATLFRNEFGVGPKQLGRIARFERSVAGLRAGRLALADLAHTGGYADQAHLAREWRELSGYSPTEYLARELPFLQDATNRR